MKFNKESSLKQYWSMAAIEKYMALLRVTFLDKFQNLVIIQRILFSWNTLSSHPEQGGLPVFKNFQSGD